MKLLGGAEPITATDDEIRAAVADADPFALVVAVAHAVGDPSLVPDDLAPDQLMLLQEDAGRSPEQVAALRAAAAEVLIRHRDAGTPPPPELAPEDLRRMVRFLVGDQVDDYLPVLQEELALDGADLRAPTWRNPGVPFRVAIIGAGMSGLLAAHRLQQAGVDFVVLEKDPDVGGTWFENTYPGCRVDVPNHFYSYSFAQTAEWPGFFSTQQALLDYFRACADEFGLRPHIRFGTEVLDATFDEANQEWALRLGDGSEPRFNAVISAVGQLNRPSFPDIPGRDDYQGETFHSARWDHGVDLRGKRVAVVGTGASAAQFIPAVAEEASELLIFQRTPPWLVPTPNYQDDLPDGLRWLLRHVPGYARWDRLWVFWKMHEGLLPAAEVDPAWDGGGRSLSALNDMVRELFTAYYDEQFPEPELRAKVLPRYPPLAKRVLRDNGIWSRTLHRDDVSLITTGIEAITEKGVRTDDGVEHVVDVLIYGTGFQASRFLTPMTVRGVGGVDLHEQWDGNARAYLGVTVPDFPNLFLLYGPNTNIVINGSIIYFSECEVRYVLEGLRLLLSRGLRTMDVRRDVHDAYNASVDEANARMAWGAADVHSWYKSPSGRVAQNWPFSLLEYWRRTLCPDPDEYVLR